MCGLLLFVIKVDMSRVRTLGKVKRIKDCDLVKVTKINDFTFKIDGVFWCEMCERNIIKQNPKQNVWDVIKRVWIIYIQVNLRIL